MQSVVRLLAGGYSGTLLLSEQANPARLPSYPFATVKILTQTPEGQAEVPGIVSNSEMQIITEYVTVSVQVQVFGPDAQTEAQHLRAWLSSTPAGDLAEEQGIGILTIGAQQRLPALTGAGFEERQVLNLTFSAKQTLTVSQRGMRIVELNTTLETPGYPGTGEQIAINQEVGP